MQQLQIHNGKVWEKTQIHLKSVIPFFHKKNIVKTIELELLQKMIR